VIRHIMVIRGFDEMDQQTIQMMCEDTQTKEPPQEATSQQLKNKTKLRT